MLQTTLLSIASLLLVGVSVSTAITEHQEAIASGSSQSKSSLSSSSHKTSSASPRSDGRGDLGGSISNGLRGWKRKKERSLREVVLASPTRDDHSGSEGDGKKRAKRPSSLDSSEGKSPLRSIPNDDEILTGQRRVMPSRLVKGKAAMTFDSSVFSSEQDESSSEYYSDTQSSKRKKKSALLKIKMLSSSKPADADHDISNPILVNAPIRKWATCRPGSGNCRQQERRKLFYSQYDKLGIDYTDDAKQTAIKLFGLTIPGLSEESTGRFISIEIRANTTPRYYQEYTRQMANLRSSIKRHGKQAAKDGSMREIDSETKRRMLLEKAVNRRDQMPRLQGKRRKPRLYARIQSQLVQIEGAIRQHLGRSNIDFDTASIDTIEQGLRNYDYKADGLKMAKGSYFDGLYAILRTKKGATEADIDQIIASRRKERFDSYNRRRENTIRKKI